MSDVDPLDLGDLAGWVGTWHWPVTKEQLLAMASDRGWEVTSNRPGKGARWRTGHTDQEASASVLDGVLAALTVPTSDRFGDAAAARGARRDTFAAQVDAVSEVLGAPGETSPGREPSATWVLSNGSSVKVEAASRCFWVVTSPEFVEIDRELGPDR